MDEERFRALRSNWKRLTDRQKRIIRERCETGKSILQMKKSLGLAESAINGDLREIYIILELENKIQDLEELICPILDELEKPEEINPPVAPEVEPETPSPQELEPQPPQTQQIFEPEPEEDEEDTERFTPIRPREVIEIPPQPQIIEDAPPIESVPARPLFSSMRGTAPLPRQRMSCLRTIWRIIIIAVWVGECPEYCVNPGSS